mmetsp:Transcript_13895/g.34316  ORF Transcript_13895/g.34316 Transcript_13895/m.34316 type:complete len:217 (-) Transcript_13895:530-1180(-)|eukprot:CAMPEP_0178997118 /NCGR_PEP_ID=MMETSP0795-20121207/8752_1 /TAXON_ID=88552 /ORGANISM="Amoebophrya sp., Strain Ameob2" /LENGTH=216 /DNA_ID=CAMNT_0020689595 /DNA_START=122 /DNA_END=772 /DNA_ORIENTATION=-
MTDRYYPRNYKPDVGNNPQGTLESTYNEMNECKTHPRSRNPPGYSGHEHGAKQKFGYSIPAPNPLPKEPIDGEDPLVNYRVGKHIVYEPLPNRKLILNKAPPPPPKAVLNYRGVETQGASLTGEDEKMATFIPQTSAYLASISGNNGAAVEKEHPYTPAHYGEGTGFNSASSYVSWLPPGDLESSSTTKDAYPPPATRFTPKGLDCLQYTLNMQKA